MRIWKICLATAALSVFLSAWAYAGSAGEPQHDKYKFQGYVYAGIGKSLGVGAPTMLEFGLGSEFRIYKGFAVGAEIGYCAEPIDTSGPSSSWIIGDAFGRLSLGGSYHFFRNRNISAFVTSGYSRDFGDANGNRFNFGGGINLCARERMGIRLEVRDHVRLNTSSTDHYLSLRLGIAFR